MATKTFQRPISLIHNVTNAEATANEVDLTVVDVSSGDVTDDFLFVYQVKTVTTNADRTAGFAGTYSKTTGKVKIADSGAADLASGDIVTVVGTFFR